MSESRDSTDGEPERDPSDDPDELRKLAILKWAVHVADAQGVWLREIYQQTSTNGGLFRNVDYHSVHATEDERRAIDMVDFLGRVFTQGTEPGALTLEIVRAMWDAARPTNPSERAQRAERVVEEHAKRYREAKAQAPNYLGNTPRQIAQHLITMLWGCVAEKFERLEKRLDEVEGELALFGVGRGRGYAATTVLAKLNKLAGNPLELSGSSSNYVRNKKRARKKRV